MQEILSSKFCGELLDIFTPNYLQLTITINHTCNFDCHYCYDKSNKNSNLNINVDALKLFLFNFKLCFHDKKVVIKILGGEPTLHKDIFSIMSLICSFDNVHKLVIVSNGSFNFNIFKSLFVELKDKIFINISYHQNKKYNIDYYVELCNNLNGIGVDFSFIYFIDSNTNLEYMKNEIEKIMPIPKYFHINGLFDVIYNEEQTKYLDKLYEKLNRNIEITTPSGTYVTPTYKIKLEKNIFKFMHCEALRTTFILSPEIHFAQACNAQNAIDGKNIVLMKKFKKTLRNATCNMDKCQCFVHYKKSKDAL